jgi:sister-chromatid-cohesion protein PDS5
MATKTNIFSASYLTVKSKTKGAEVKELTTRLKTLHQAFSELSQDEEERDQLKILKTIAGQLVSKRMLNHADKDIRSFVCCCIVDILRIFVPESPFR